MVRVRDRVAPRQQVPRQLPVALRVGLGDHEVAAQEADRVLDGSLLVPGIRVAEPRLEPVVVAEHGEHAHHGDLVPRDAVAGSRGVVEHQHAGSHADVVEDLGQPLAHAFRVLARHRRHVAHVRVRERGDQAVDLDVPAADRGDGLAEIDLHGPGAPVELEVPVAVGPVILAPPPHVALHRRVGALEALLLDESVVHAPGGVALLAGHEPVRGQPRVDRLRMRVDQGAPSLPDRGLRGAVLHGRVFPDGIPRHAKLSGDFAP